MSIPVGSTWRCIDKCSEHYGKLCLVKEIDDDPDYNGDGTIVLLYSDGSEHYGKVRRFMPGHTHVRK